MDLLCVNKLSLKEAAKKLGVGETTMRRLVRRGELPCIKLGSKQLFLEQDLNDYLQARYGRVQQPEFPTAHLQLASL